MFRKKRNAQKKTLDIYWRGGTSALAIGRIWNRMMVELESDYVEIVNGPKFYSLDSDAYSDTLNNSYWGFEAYISRKGKVSIYVPDNFES